MTTTRCAARCATGWRRRFPDCASRKRPTPRKRSAVEGARFDVVLMDIGLPGINGVEATRRLRQCDPQTKVVLISAHDSNAGRTASLEAGAVAFVAKLRMHQGLHAVLGRLLAESRAPDCAGGARDERVAPGAPNTLR